MYKLTKYNSVIRLSDGACIPFATGNRDYQEYLGWLDKGNLPEPAQTPEEIINDIKNSIIANTQTYLDSFAQTRGYDGTVSIGKYIGITDDEINALPVSLQALTLKFRLECKYLSLMTAATWAKCYEILGEVEKGTRSMPESFEEIKGELPVLAWPNN